MSEEISVTLQCCSAIKFGNFHGKVNICVKKVLKKGLQKYFEPPPTSSEYPGYATALT